MSSTNASSFLPPLEVASSSTDSLQNATTELARRYSYLILTGEAELLGKLFEENVGLWVCWESKTESFGSKAEVLKQLEETCFPTSSTQKNLLSYIYDSNEAGPNITVSIPVYEENAEHQLVQVASHIHKLCLKNTGGALSILNIALEITEPEELTGKKLQPLFLFQTIS